MSLQGKVALVTGASRGIGQAIALELGRLGAVVIGTATSASGAEKIAETLKANGVEGAGLVLDVSSDESVAATLEHIQQHLGQPLIVVNNAGITHRGTFAETGLGVFRKVMAVNFFGAVHCTRAALPSLLERRGQIVVLGSLTGFAPLLYRSAYNASKHALHGLFDTLRMELEGTGVSVTLACPGFTATDLRKNALVGDGSVTRQPVQVLGSQVASPVEVAEAIFQGAARRRRLLVLSNVNWRARLLARFFPRLFEKLLVPRLSGLKPQP
ncbi:SDR family oxidoreductase [Pseudomonas aeruginosa]|uniref:SDR family oxidoreductase n=1 Tax=Pseudomonas aeruginosa TaxID=287 RepID=UPI00064C9A50|nr:SDR family oxidoreductase [Pseudomonas aeruginosa]